MKVWISLLVIYSSFFIWYTDLGGKLTDDEIEYYANKFESNALKDGRVLDPRGMDLIQKFMEEDSGKQFLMVNVIDMSENPTFPDGTVSEESADNLMNEYMEHMYGEILKRASHPVFMGSAVNNSMDLVGIENAEVWETAALFRYKSRRAFLEIVTHPDMNSKHKYKIAALEKTIAFPVETQLYLGDPRLLLGFIFLILGLLLRPITRR
jgi:hypothetical protein